MNKQVIFNIKVDSTDKYIDYIVHKYDLNLEELNQVVIPLVDKTELESFKWNIGLICGESGSGKSTTLETQFGKPIKPNYDEDKPVVCQFQNLEPENVCEILESVGLSSVPVWLRKPSNLSVGEKARLDLAWTLANVSENQLIIIDEFTSTINREVAKSLAFCLQRYVREHDIKVVISTCHFDMIEYLQPDWIYNLNKRNGDIVELERLVYLDEYENYPNVNPDDVLSEDYPI